MCDLINVGTSSLTDGGEGIDGGYTLGKHGIGCKLGQLR